MGVQKKANWNNSIIEMVRKEDQATLDKVSHLTSTNTVFSNCVHNLAEHDGKSQHQDTNV